MKRSGLIGDVHAEDRLLGIALEHFGLVDLAGMQLQWLATAYAKWSESI